MDFKIRVYQEPDESAVIAIWEKCGLVTPQNDPRRDIELKVRFQPELLLVAELDWQVVGTVMAGYEGHRGWLNYLAVDPDHQRKGFGRLLAEAGENRLKELGCPKVNLLVREKEKPLLTFYRAIGYVTEDLINMGKRVEQPGPAQ